MRELLNIWTAKREIHLFVFIKHFGMRNPTEKRFMHTSFEEKTKTKIGGFKRLKKS
jgi:hypothetical protein